MVANSTVSPTSADVSTQEGLGYSIQQNVNSFDFFYQNVMFVKPDGTLGYWEVAIYDKANPSFPLVFSALVGIPLGTKFGTDTQLLLITDPPEMSAALVNTITKQTVWSTDLTQNGYNVGTLAEPVLFYELNIVGPGNLQVSTFTPASSFLITYHGSGLSYTQPVVETECGTIPLRTAENSNLYYSEPLAVLRALTQTASPKS